MPLLARRYLRLGRSRLRQRLLPVCARCCRLYSYPVHRAGRRLAYLR